MRLSSGLFEVCLEACSLLEHGPQDVDSPSCEGDDSLVMAFAFAPLSVVEGAAVGMAEGAEGGLVEDAFEGFVAAAGPPQEPDLAGLTQHRGDTGGRSESKDSLPSYTVEVGHKQVPAYFRHGGVVLDSIALEFARSGAAAATIQCVAQGEERFAASQGGTPSKLDFRRISQFQGSISRAGPAVANLTGGSLTYANNLEKIETIRSDGLIDGADPTVAALTGSIEVRFADTTLIDLASNGAPVDLEFAYAIDSGLKIAFEAHEVYLPKPALTVEGPGGVSARFDFQGARNETEGRMLTVTLINDLDGSDYS